MHIVELERIVNEQQFGIQKLNKEFDDDKIIWNKQHHEHLIGVEELYNHRIKSIEDEVVDVKRENDQLRIENSRLEQELISQHAVCLNLLKRQQTCTVIVKIPSPNFYI